MARAILLTGGNIGDTESTLAKAKEFISSNIGNVIKHSVTYKSKAWGFNAEGDFLNQALEVDTSLSPEELLLAIHEIEGLLGRDRDVEDSQAKRSGEAYASRKIDIDIIFYDDLIVDSDNLTIPHPLMHERKFVLEPLKDILPDKIHPVIGKSVDQIYAELIVKQIRCDC